MWNTFNCTTILDYHNLYLQAYLLLLADTWENVKLYAMYDIHKLAVSFYYTRPGLSWDAFFEHTDEHYIKEYNIHFEIELF